jgi:hypothetical protein
MSRSALRIAANALRVAGVGILFALVVLSAFSLLTILSRATIGVSLRLAVAGVGVSALLLASGAFAIWIGSREGSQDSH